MKKLQKHLLTSIFLLFIVAYFQDVSAQSPAYKLLLSKIETEKVRTLNAYATYQIKTISGKKVQAGLLSFSEKAMLSLDNDTILFEDIRWIKTPANLTKTQKILAVSGAVIGIIYMYPATMAGLFFWVLYSQPLLMLLPALPASLTVFSLNSLKWRKFRLKNWELSVTPVLDENQNLNME